MNSFIRKAIFVIAWLVIWQVVASALNNPWLIASPLQVVDSLLQLGRTLEFWTTIGTTFLSIFGAFVLSAVCGIVLGQVCSRFSIISDFLAPAIHVIKSAPVVCIIAILLVALGSSVTVVVVVALVVFPQYFYATIQARNTVSPLMIRLTRLYNVSTLNRFLCIDFANLIPNLQSTSKSAVGMAWKSGVAAELIGLTSSTIGEAVYLSKVHLDVSAIIAWTLVVILLGWASEKLVVLALEGLAHIPKRHLSAIASRATSYSHDNCLVPQENNTCACSIELEGVSVSYGTEQVFDLFNLTIQPGEVVCLMAPSGSGKTTLLSVMDKSICPTDGTVKVLSTVDSVPTLSVMFQDSVLLEWASAKENIAFVAGSDSEVTTGTKYLEAILPAEVLDKPVSELSGGQRRRVEICRALAHPSCAILLDEPFSGLDTDIKLKVINLIKRERHGRTIVVATHDERDANELSARVVTL